MGDICYNKIIKKVRRRTKERRRKKGLKEEKTKVALVTGGNRGIGAGIVEVFAEKGYDIFLAHYGEKEKADAVADIVQNKYGRKCKCMDISLSNSDAAVKILNCVLETYGRIDALLSNAGM